jgi:hypothetical protein
MLTNADWRKQEPADLFRYDELPDGDYFADHMGEWCITRLLNG